MNPLQKINQCLSEAGFQIHPVVDFRSSDKLYPFDLTAANTELNPAVLGNTDAFTAWIADKLSQNQCRYGIGGYNEHRTIYARSVHFDGAEGPRRLHLGVDIWGPAGTAVYNFYDAEVHSFCFNDHFGDYGSTIILKYTFKDFTFYALYGHLDLQSLEGLKTGLLIPKGKHFASFGSKEENGCWPPHLHFQLILDMQGRAGDYPGVCKFSERQSWLNNCPDPELVLQYTFPSENL